MTCFGAYISPTPGGIHSAEKFTQAIFQPTACLFGGKKEKTKKNKKTREVRILT